MPLAFLSNSIGLFFAFNKKIDTNNFFIDSASFETIIGFFSSLNGVGVPGMLGIISLAFDFRLFSKICNDGFGKLQWY